MATYIFRRSAQPDLPFIVYLIPLIMALAVQSWLLYLTHTPARAFDWQQFFAVPVDSQEPAVPSNSPEAASNQVPSAAQLETMFEAYGNYYGVDPQVLRHIAKCESHANPLAVSRTGKYVGLYQFDTRTWVANRQRMGYDADANLRLDAAESIKTAAYKIKNGGIHAWPICSKSVLARI